MKDEINATMLGIGIALEVLTGQQISTPLWMKRAGFEWLFCILERSLGGYLKDTYIPVPILFSI